MRRMFGGATLLCAAITAQAGLIRADFRTGAVPAGADFLSNHASADCSEPWADQYPAADTLAPQAHAGLDFDATGLALANSAGPGVIGIPLLAATPPVDDTPMPGPQTLVLLGLGAGALGLARQDKSKRA